MFSTHMDQENKHSLSGTARPPQIENVPVMQHNVPGLINKFNSCCFGSNVPAIAIYLEMCLVTLLSVTLDCGGLILLHKATQREPLMGVTRSPCRGVNKAPP